MSDEADDDLRLMSMGPTPGGGFGIDLTGGPVHAFAAHLIDLMTGPDGKMWNCMETEVNASDNRGSFTLTVQRRNGKAPLQLKAEAEKLLRQTVEAIDTGRSEPLFIMRDMISNWLESLPSPPSPPPAPSTWSK